MVLTRREPVTSGSITSQVTSLGERSGKTSQPLGTDRIEGNQRIKTNDCRERESIKEENGLSFPTTGVPSHELGQEVDMIEE